MKRIAVIGESPYDTQPLCKVWNEKYKNTGKFSVFLKRVEGSVLYSPRITDLLKAELKRTSTDFDIFVVVRDLDSARSDKMQRTKINDWYTKVVSVFPNAVLLLNIQELEALILADMESFNKIYNTKIKSIGNPETVISPKDFLISQTRKTKKKFAVIDNNSLLPKLDFQKVEDKCQFYREFLLELEPLLGIKRKKS